jgi:hypothetical protein
MKRKIANTALTLDARATSEVLILPDGRILAHNISPVIARVLAELDPADEQMKQRATQKKQNEIPG